MFKVKISLFCIFLLFSTALYASNIQMSSNSEGNLVITGDSCQALLDEEVAICQWKQKLEPNFKLPAEIATKNTKRCSALKGKKFRLTVSSCLPEFAKNYQGKNIVHDGPNCWGTAMSFHDISPKPRFMWPEEISYWHENTPLCRKLAPDEKKLPGDVINVYAPEYIFSEDYDPKDKGVLFWNALFPKRFQDLPVGKRQGYSGFHRLLHSETYISPNMTFGKDSPSKLDKFKFNPIGEVYGRPRDENKDCQENQTLSPHIREYTNQPKEIKRSKCAYFTLAYRCENYANYFDSQNLSEDEKVIYDKIKSMQGLQEELYNQIFTNKRKLSECEVQLILASADINAKLALEELAKPNLSKNMEMLLTWDYFTATGIRKSLEFAKLIK